jgi:hypothetical protein
LTEPPRGALATLIYPTSLLVDQSFAIEALAIDARPA